MQKNKFQKPNNNDFKNRTKYNNYEFIKYFNLNNNILKII